MGLIKKCQRWLSSVLVLAESALAPIGWTCGCCGNTYRKKRALSVCGNCWASIPWIHEVQCGRCGRYENCTDCERREGTYFVRNRSAVRYDEQMKSWLAMYKYRGQERLSAVLGPMLLHAWNLHRSCGESGGVELLTYVPLSKVRYGERGFNQAEQLAAELGRSTGIPVVSLFERTRHTDKQSFKTRAERLRDMLGAFRLNPAGVRALQAAQVGGGEVKLYIIDDVYTTGSTLNECARTVKELLPQVQVYGLNWAR